MNFFISKGWKEIHHVCKDNDVVKLDNLIKGKKKLNELTSDGWSALHIACQYGSTDCVKTLITNGVDKNLICNDWKPIEIACYNDFEEIVEYLLDKDVDINKDKKTEYKLLFFAINNQNLNIVKLLVKKGIDPEVKDPYGWTALHIAARDNYCDLAEYLISKLNVNQNYCNENDETPLLIASQMGNLGIIQKLNTTKKDINITNKDGWNSFHIACQYNNPEVVKIFLNIYPEIINTVTTKEDSMYPLHIAIFFNNIDIISILLNSNPDLEKKNGNELTPLEYAIDIKNNEAVEKINNYIKEKKLSMISNSNFNIFLNNNFIFSNCSQNLINAIKDNKSDAEIINLINTNTGLEYIDKCGWTALHWACYNGRTEIVKELIERNVKIDRRTSDSGEIEKQDYRNKTAKEIASLRHNTEVVRIIDCEITNRRTNKALNIVLSGVEFMFNFI